MEFKENTDFDLIGLGEVMLRLSPPNKEKISQSETFEKNAGGSELNVVSGAAMLGIRSAIVTKLPENKMGHFIRNKIRYGNVSDDYIIYDHSPQKRLGVYYYESGAYPEQIQVFVHFLLTNFRRIYTQKLRFFTFQALRLHLTHH